MEQVIFTQEDFAAGQQGFVASSPLQASQWGSMQKSLSAVVLDIGKFLVEDTLPAGVVSASLAQPHTDRAAAVVRSIGFASARCASVSSVRTSAVALPGGTAGHVLSLP